ncbi:glycosyltransferase involved in cell wall biosynthesis [Melghirimyces profundicolus]|uniref:Glycosyltransferase involved in cell wall biosynthesis n=1 Tax=Melghirimyces profundicolus TaxID=1242148 RepID=A0A2T6BCE9_9BACL|nr:glycosyltransferase family 4 protein [Melghirimyces profundicolus]PTX53733.1 glycosyltransferase involved in cell wall biosynthesis [Melghirimyces profundicolus]
MRDYRHRLAILNNNISPYRIPVYSLIGENFNTTVLFSGREDNRTTWAGLENRLREKGLSAKRSWGFTIKYKRKRDGQVFDRHYLHINLGYIWDLFRERPDAVITIEMGFRTIAALVYGALSRKPVWVWWGGTLHTESTRGPFKRIVRRLLARWVRHWISYGQTSTEYLMSIGVSRERILQIQNCVDETFFNRPVKPAIMLKQKPVLLYVGQLIGRKGVRLLLEAAARMQEEGHRFSLLLVGEGAERESLVSYARELGLVDVYFHPAQPPEKMPAIYRSADCLVFPTLEDVWGLVVNEAMWSGIPVLASKYAGCAPEIVPTKQGFDPLNPSDFDRALRLALTGELNPPDTSSLKTYRQVADMIINDIQREVQKR